MRLFDIVNRPTKIVEKKTPAKTVDYSTLLEQKLREKTSKLLDKKTPTVADLAEKYKTSLGMIELELKKGIKVEMEHTSKHSVAKEIALDHLGEDLHYYEKLAKVEKDVEENFADGRHPEDKGDSRRHGIPKKASLSQLDKIGHGSGRKAQLARWQANMRRGRKK